MAYASRALEVMEAQYQNEVRLAIQNLYIAYVDVLAARETVRYLQTSIKGLDEVLRVYEGLYEQKNATSADVDQARSDREIALSGLLDAEEAVRQRKRGSGRAARAFARPGRATRAAGNDRRPGARRRQPSRSWLQLALTSRPDVAAYRLGIAAAEANVGLQRANRFSDAYLLYQPYTYQNNAPYRQAERHVVGAGNHGSAAGLQPQPGQHRAREDQRVPVRGAVGVLRRRRVETEVRQAIEGIPGRAARLPTAYPQSRSCPVSNERTAIGSGSFRKAKSPSSSF